MVTNRFKGMDWMAVIFYPLAVILMEAFWVSPWLNWMGLWPIFRETRPVLSLASVIIVLAASLLMTRIVSRQKMPMWALQLSIIGGGVVVLLLVVAAEYTDGYVFLSGGWFAHMAQVLGNTFKNPGTVVFALPVIIYLWWRGIVLGQSTTYFKDIYRSFLIGLVALIFLLIIWQVSSSSGKIASPGAGLGLNVIAFFFFGLLSIAICHLYTMRRTMPKEEAALTSVWRWLPIMLGVIGGMVLLGFAVASIFSPEIFDSISAGFKVIGSFLGKAVTYIMAPFVYLIAGLIYVFKWFLALLRGEQQQEQQEGEMGGMPEFGEVTTKDIPPWATEALKWVIIAVIIGVIIFILARTISRYRARKAQEEIDETRESLFSWRGLRDDLKLFLNMVGDRFKRKPGEAGSAFDPDARGRLDIREIFRHLQWEGGRSGITRRRHETAGEYAYRLERAVPDSIESISRVRESVGGIKEMYEQARYGEADIPEPQVDKANSLWQALKGMLRRIRGEG